MNSNVVTLEKSPRQNCNAHLMGDTIRCAAERMGAQEIDGVSFDSTAEITIEEARRDYHSFGGEMPKEIREGMQLSQSEGPYPPEAYSRFENRAVCDSCGHKCLNG
jgi:hypothetical protein